MVSEIGQMTADQLTPADIQRYVMDIINMERTMEGDKLHEQAQLGRIIINAPHLTTGLTPYVLELARQGYHEGLDSMLKHAPEYIDPIAVELFAKTIAKQAPLQKEFQTASLLLERIIKVRPEIKPAVKELISEAEIGIL